MAAFFYHWRVWFIGLFCLVNALNATGIINALIGDTWWLAVWVVFQWVTLVLFLGALFGDLRHNSVTCIDCMAAIPSDAAHQVVVHDSDMRLWHWAFARSYWNILIMIAPLPLGLVVMGVFRERSSILYFIGMAIVVAWWYSRYRVHRSESIHMQLKSFCPYCKGGNDDDREPIPDPVDDGVKHRGK